MRNYNPEAREKLIRSRAIMISLIIHLGLLYGLLYVNNKLPENLSPDLIKEWIKKDKQREPVASRNLN